MLKCTVNGRTIGFSFEHIQDFGAEVGIQAVTHCRLTVGDMPDIELYTAQAFCSVQDIFNKNTGRKVSLNRALLKSALGKDERREVWQRYFLRDLNNTEYAFWVVNGFLPGEPVVIEEGSNDKTNENFGNV